VKRACYYSRHVGVVSTLCDGSRIEEKECIKLNLEIFPRDGGGREIDPVGRLTTKLVHHPSLLLALS
jgi:hypothetical protein